MSNISLRPLCYVEDVEHAVHTAFQKFYDNQDKYTNLKQLMELTYEEFKKIPTYTPEFVSRSKKETEEYLEKQRQWAGVGETGPVTFK